jgi:glycosyltransferase involved in cell wall biosynthesis
MKVVLFANTDWYLYNFRRSLAEALRRAGHDLLLVSPDGAYGERLRALGFRWVPLEGMDRRSLNPMREALVLWNLVRLFRLEKPDLVHGFTIKCAVYGSLASRLAGVRARVNAVAGLGYVFISNSLKARVLRPIVRSLLRLALSGDGARLILQNSDDVALFETCGIVKPGRAVLIPSSGVDCERFSPLENDQLEGRPFRVLLSARLLWDKGVRELIGAARLLKSEGRDIEFLLAGEPDEGNPASVPRSDLLQWVDEGLVRWLGHVDDMPTLLRTVHVVALPSYREGLPKGLIEAGACARALVTTDAPGCREVVTDGLDGLIVPVRTVEPLARAIARLQDDPVLRRRLGEGARESVLRRYDERLVIAETIAVYNELSGAGA